MWPSLGQSVGSICLPIVIGSEVVMWYRLSLSSESKDRLSMTLSGFEPEAWSNRAAGNCVVTTGMTNQGLKKKTMEGKAEKWKETKPLMMSLSQYTMPFLKTHCAFIYIYCVCLATITKCHRLSDLNNRNLFLAVLKARSPRSRFQLIRCLARVLFPVLRWPPSCCVLTGPFHGSRTER